jgi:hypothetical protein
MPITNSCDPTHSLPFPAHARMPSENSLRELLGKLSDSVEESQVIAMSDKSPTSKFHSNRYHALAACEHCAGVIRHEPWCITRDPMV